MSQLKAVSSSIFIHFSSVASSTLFSSFLGSDPVEIKNKLQLLSDSETTHFDTIYSMLQIYNVAQANTTELNDFSVERKASPTAITTEDELVEMLSSLALTSERAICDINKEMVKVSNTQLNELFTRLETASINHLKVSVGMYEDLQGTYSPQLLSEINCGTGVTYTSKVGTSTTGSVDEHIDVYLTVENSGVSSVQVSEKDDGGVLEYASLKENSSLRYVDYLENQMQVLTTLINSKVAVFNSNTTYDLIDDIITAHGTHILASTEALAIYDVTADTGNSSIDTFYSFIDGKVLTDTNTTMQDQNVLKTLALIQERIIIDIEDNIINEITSPDIENIYKAFGDSSKNHLKIIDKILTDNFSQPYVCQLLTTELCSTILPYSDDFISGTPVTNP